MAREGVYPAIQVTNACNKSCQGCLRSARSPIPGTPDGITYDKFKQFMEDLRVLGSQCQIKSQYVTGGEPTLWREGDRDVADLLAQLSELRLSDHVTMASNGKLFEDAAYARDFFTRLSAATAGYVTVGISIGRFQENFSDSGYVALDNLIQLSEEPGIRLRPFVILTLAVDDDTDERVRRAYPDVPIRVRPLAPLGEAALMPGACPSLRMSGRDKSTLGAYRRHFRRDVYDRLRLSATDFEEIPNSELLDRMSLHAHCGASPFIDDRWHYCLPLKDDDRYAMCPIGGMRRDTFQAFLSTVPVQRAIRAYGVITAVKNWRQALTPETRDRLDGMLSSAATAMVSVAFRGCMVCRAFYDAGIITDLNRGATT